MNETPSDRFIEGMATRRSVLGDVHVDRAGAATTEFDRPFQELITEAAWGHVWSRPALTKRERSMITIALLAALGQDDVDGLLDLAGPPDLRLLGRCVGLFEPQAAVRGVGEAQVVPRPPSSRRRRRSRAARR